MRHFAWIVLSGLVTGLVGCATTPGTVQGPVSASRVGDRGRTYFSEIVASLKVRRTNEAFNNLHVLLGAAINPKFDTPVQPYTAQEIVQQCDARISARVTTLLLQTKEVELNDMDNLREAIRSEAQKVVDEAMKQWDGGMDYKVEVQVLQLYWTNSSVGASIHRRGW